jgi:hypothetical protein
MKVLRRLSIIITIWIGLQLGVLFYLNNFYFNLGGRITFNNINLNNNKPLKNTELTLPGDQSKVDWDSIKFSDDGAFMTFIQDGDLIVMNLSDQSIKTISTEDMYIKKRVVINGEIYNQPIYLWTPGKDILLVGYISESNKSSGRRLKLMTYDALNNTKRYEEKFSKNFLNIKSDRYITEMTASPMTNEIFVKIDGGYRPSKLYRININSDIFPIETGVNFVGKMVESQMDYKLFYENEKIYITNSANYHYNKTIYEINKGVARDRILRSNEYIHLLGVDGQDKVYYGEFNRENQLLGIKYYDSENGIYKNLAVPDKYLLKKVNPADIVVCSNEVYINDKLNKTIEGVKGRKTKSYKGKLIQITNDYFITLDNGKVMVNKFNN